METITGIVFIGTVIAGITQFIKLATPEWFSGKYTIVVAVLVGIIVALVDTHIGVQDISVASGIMIALGTTGTVATLEKIG